MPYGIQLLLWCSGRSVQLYQDPEGYADGGIILRSFHPCKGAVWGTSGSHDALTKECLVR